MDVRYCLFTFNFIAKTPSSWRPISLGCTSQSSKSLCPLEVTAIVSKKTTMDGKEATKSTSNKTNPFYLPPPSCYSSSSLTNPLILWPVQSYVSRRAAGIQGILHGTSWCTTCACLILWQTPHCCLKCIFRILEKCRSEEVAHRNVG